MDPDIDAAAEEGGDEPQPRRLGFTFRRRKKAVAEPSGFDLETNPSPASDDLSDPIGDDDIYDDDDQRRGPRITRQTRIGIAAVLSFLILVGVMVANKMGAFNKKTGSEEIAATGSEATNTGDEDKDKDKETETPPRPTPIARINVDSPTKPEPKPAEPPKEDQQVAGATPPKPDEPKADVSTGSRTASTESEPKVEPEPTPLDPKDAIAAANGESITLPDSNAEDTAKPLPLGSDNENLTLAAAETEVTPAPKPAEEPKPKDEPAPVSPAPKPAVDLVAAKPETAEPPAEAPPHPVTPPSDVATASVDASPAPTPLEGPSHPAVETPTPSVESAAGNSVVQTGVTEPLQADPPKEPPPATPPTTAAGTETAPPAPTPQPPVTEPAPTPAPTTDPAPSPAPATQPSTSDPAPSPATQPPTSEPAPSPSNDPKPPVSEPAPSPAPATQPATSDPAPAPSNDPKPPVLEPAPSPSNDPKPPATDPAPSPAPATPATVEPPAPASVSPSPPAETVVAPASPAPAAAPDPAAAPPPEATPASAAASPAVPVPSASPSPSSAAPDPSASALKPVDTPTPTFTPTEPTGEPPLPTTPVKTSEPAANGTSVKIPTIGRNRMIDLDDRRSPEPVAVKEDPTFVDVTPNRSSRIKGTAGGASSAMTATTESEPERAASMSTPHTVQRGENLWTISRLYYGYGWYYKALWEANKENVAAVDKLYVGQTIRIPPPEDLDPAYVESARKEFEADRKARGLASSSRGAGGTDSRATPVNVSLRKASRSADLDSGELKVSLPTADPLGHGQSVGGFTEADEEEEPTEPVRKRGPRYKIRAYETLRSIARDTLGDSRRSTEIYELNQSVVDDPNHLVTGQIIELPADARVGRVARKR